MYSYKTKGVCSSEIQIELDGDKIKSVNYINGCNGNTKGISALVEGMEVGEVIKRCENITCNHRPTSCPGQLAIALKQILDGELK